MVNSNVALIITFAIVFVSITVIFITIIIIITIIFITTITIIVVYSKVYPIFVIFLYYLLIVFFF